MTEVVISTRILPHGVLVPLLIGGIIMAACYGATFMLTAHLIQLDLNPMLAGKVVSAGTIVTLISAIFAGRIAERLGLEISVSISAFLMALAMLSFGLATVLPVAIFAGGVLLGAAWAVFYILAPLVIIDIVDSSARIRYLTFLSGAQMLGLGLSEPAGSALNGLGVSYGVIYGSLSLLSILCGLLFLRMQRNNSQSERQASHALTLSAAFRILSQQTALPAIIIALLACVFSSLATFQTLYATPRGLDGSIFFMTFTVATVLLRFSVASLISKLPIYTLAIALIMIVMLSLGLLTFNAGSFALYVLASAIFAVGYGLSYSTLNAIAVNLAETKGLSVSASSQIFTLFYFIGIFGFPFVAGQLIAFGSMEVMLRTLFVACFGALVLGAVLRVRFERKATPSL